MTDLLTVTIIRQTPPAEPYRRTYEVPADGLLRVLDVLNHIYEYIDPSLAYATCCAGTGSATPATCPSTANVSWDALFP